MVGHVGWDGALRLLGASARETVAAERGLLGLRDVHETHGRVRRETMVLQLQPGVVLGPLQLAHLWTAHMHWGTTMADMMKLCELAASHQRWHDMVFVPEVLRAPAPLPEYQWFQGDPDLPE